MEQTELVPLGIAQDGEGVVAAAGAKSEIAGSWRRPPPVAPAAAERLT